MKSVIRSSTSSSLFSRNSSTSSFVVAKNSVSVRHGSVSISPPSWANTSKSLCHGPLGDQIAPTNFYNDSVIGKIIFGIGFTSMVALMAEMYVEKPSYALSSRDKDTTFQPTPDAWCRPDRRDNNMIEKRIPGNGGSHEYTERPLIDDPWFLRPHRMSLVGTFGSILGYLGLWSDKAIEEMKADGGHGGHH